METMYCICLVGMKMEQIRTVKVKWSLWRQRNMFGTRKMIITCSSSNWLYNRRTLGSKNQTPKNQIHLKAKQVVAQFSDDFLLPLSHVTWPPWTKHLWKKIFLWESTMSHLQKQHMILIGCFYYNLFRNVKIASSG